MSFTVETARARISEAMPTYPLVRTLANTAFRPVSQERGDIPLYRLVKRSLLRAVEGGIYPSGSALPNEWDLAKALDVSIGTLRRAVEELVAEQILVRRRGRGTFVSKNENQLPFHFFNVERYDGLREAPRTELVSFERVRIDEEAAEALDMACGSQGIQIDNRLILQGSAVIHIRATIPTYLFKGLTEKRVRERSSNLFHLYQTEFGVTVIRVREQARALPANAAAARILGLATNTPVMQVRGTALTFGDRPVEYRLMTINTLRHYYVRSVSPLDDVRSVLPPS